MVARLTPKAEYLVGIPSIVVEGRQLIVGWIRGRCVVKCLVLVRGEAVLKRKPIARSARTTVVVTHSDKS